MTTMAMARSFHFLILAVVYCAACDPEESP